MSDLNVVALVGRIAKNAELKVRGETTVCEFTIAVNTDKKDGSTGEYSSVPNFIPLALFGEYGKKMAAHLYKGRTVSVVGALKVDTWVKDNQSYSKVGVTVHRIGLAFPLPVKGDVRSPDKSETAESVLQEEPEIPFNGDEFDIV